MLFFFVMIIAICLISIAIYSFEPERKRNKKLNKLRERIEFYGFLTDICRDMANAPTMHRNNYRARSEFFYELERKTVEEYNKLNGENND